MRSPSITDLPAAPPDKRGWPWTEESQRLPERRDDDPWPRITVVTPSFNQGQFIEETIRSILLQGYPNLEYFVLDGGSTDHTVAIIEKYSPWIDFWVSERDRGQSAAINRGLRMGSGSHATWICSDDMLHKDALFALISARQLEPDVAYVGDCVNIDADGHALFSHRGNVHSFEDLVRFRDVWRSGGYLCQQEVLFPLPLMLEAGALNEDNHYSMDFELWGELFLKGARMEYTGIPFGFFRWHQAQKTQHAKKQTDSSLNAAEALIRKAAMFSEEQKQALIADLHAYREEFPDIVWKQTGRLARLGLPPFVVTPLRTITSSVKKATGNLIGTSK